MKISDIIKSKFSNKENLPEWYEKRLSICSECSFNSLNKPKKDWTFQDKKWNTLNLGKPFCTACGCELAAKASIPHAVCGLKSIGLDPKWKAVDDSTKSGFLKISNISTTPTIMSERQGVLWLDLGELKNGQETDVRIKIHNEKNDMTDISAKADCGCTVPNLERRNEFIYMSIRYNTKRQGDFEKAVTLSYKQNNTQFSKIIKITGKVE